MGTITLANFMKKISTTAELSTVYTNHCIRATTITLLNHCGFESRHITTVSGHKNQSSLTSYCYDTSDQQKKSMSDALSRSRCDTMALAEITNTASSNECTYQDDNCASSVLNKDLGSLDFLDIPDNVLVTAVEQYESTMSVKVSSEDKFRPHNFNFSNCVVHIKIITVMAVTDFNNILWT